MMNGKFLIHFWSVSLKKGYQMIPKVTIFYDIVSPYSLFGFVSICRYARLWNIELILAPALLGAVMQNAGNQPPATNPYKGRYMVKDLGLNASLFGTKTLKTPSDFPANTLRAQRILTAIKLKQSEILIDVSLAFWDAYWINGETLDEETYHTVLSKFTKNPDEILDLAKGEQVKNELLITTEQAMDSGAFGFPWFLCEKGNHKQVFFGSDRLEAMAHWLGKPYHGVNPKAKF